MEFGEELWLPTYFLHSQHCWLTAGIKKGETSEIQCIQCRSVEQAQTFENFCAQLPFLPSFPFLPSISPSFLYSTPFPVPAIVRRRSGST